MDNKVRRSVTDKISQNLNGITCSIERGVFEIGKNDKARMKRESPK